eukprot:TRINITY_DN11968_c0_g3_i1.p1 TRINITY_DN11968_c0_g3~~TRINITY_DN11968_c0_g3_i1.p1  ORF type:complete len:231 (-),score=79.42 TRINITY_DN11968_c0_g3_i1:88-690(-)
MLRSLVGSEMCIRDRCEMLDEAEEMNAKNSEQSNSALKGPGDIGPKYTKKKEPKKKRTTEIWDEDEVPEEDLNFGVDDGDNRPEPEYRTAYRQGVRSEDMFLGIDGKDPGSHCCDDLIVTVELPGVASLEAISLDVTKNTLRVSTPTHRLAMYLPHTVDDKEGNAKWDSDKCELRLTLPIVHKDILDLPDREEILDKYRE